jgi:sec-independent protein translocase protein TatB
MFDFDVGKILAVAVVALIVVGPKDLPRVLVRVARTFGTVRRAALQFRRHAMDMINEADLDGVKKELTPLNRSIAADFAYNAKTAMRGHLPKTAVAQEEASSAAATAAAKVAGVTYSSPEMREYMSTSPSPAVDANAGSSPACGVAKTEPAEPSAAEATQTEIPIAD